MQGCVISCGTVVFFQKSRNLSRSLLTYNKFYCENGTRTLKPVLSIPQLNMQLQRFQKLPICQIFRFEDLFEKLLVHFA